MKFNRNYEAELNIKDFLFHILYKWRIVLLVGFLAAGVFGFIEYWSFEKYHKAGELTPAEIQYEKNVEENQRKVENAKTTLEKYEEYVTKKIESGENSILMRIDMSNVWTAEKKYYVNVEPAVKKNDSSLITTDSVTKILVVLAEAFSTEFESSKLKEVFETDELKEINQVAFIFVDKDLHTVTVVGCGASKEEAIRRKEFVDSYLLEASEKLSKSENHTLEIVSDFVTKKTVLPTKNENGKRDERELSSIQKGISESMQYYRDQIAAYTKEWNELRGKVFTKPVPNTKEQALFGFALGVFLTILMFAIHYLFSGKLKTSRELRNRYGLSLFGELTHSRAWWKGKGIDWMLERLEFGKKTVAINELNNIASLIDRKKNGETILLTSTLEEKEIKKVYEGLFSRLQEKGISLVMQPEYLHNSEAVTASRDASSVILVEEKYKSRVRDLNRMAEMMTIENANVIGAVLI